MARHRRRPELLLLSGAVLLSTAAAALLMSRPAARNDDSQKPNLNLKVADQKGRMRIDWDASNPAVQAAEGATLEVQDGGSIQRYPVEPGILKSGGLDYVRRSEDVLLTLTLLHGGQPGSQSSVRRIAPVEQQVTAAAPKPQPRRRSSSRSRGRRR